MFAGDQKISTNLSTSRSPTRLTTYNNYNNNNIYNNSNNYSDNNNNTNNNINNNNIINYSNYYYFNNYNYKNSNIKIFIYLLTGFPRHAHIYNQS